jgi:hypothetical protein
MHKSILLLSTITLACFSCNDIKDYTVKQKAIPNSSLTSVSIIGAVQQGQDCKQLQKNYVALDSSKRELELMFDAAIIRLDSLVGYNELLEKKLTERNREIEKLKLQVRTLSAKKAQ